MKNCNSFHQEFGTDCMRVYRLKSDNFYSGTMLSQWNPGSIQINGKIPTHFNGARISCISVFFHSSLIFVSQLSGRLLSVQVKITAFYSYVSRLLSVFSRKKKKKKSEKVLCIVLVLYHSLHCSELKRKELSGVSGRKRTKMQAKGLNAACV